MPLLETVANGSPLLAAPSSSLRFRGVLAVLPWWAALELAVLLAPVVFQLNLPIVGAALYWVIGWSSGRAPLCLL